MPVQTSPAGRHVAGDNCCCLIVFVIDKKLLTPGAQVFPQGDPRLPLCRGR